MVQSPSIPNDNTLLSLIEALEPPRKSAPLQDVLEALFAATRSAPPKPPVNSLNSLALGNALLRPPAPHDAVEYGTRSSPKNSLTLNSLGNFPAPQLPVAAAPMRRKAFFSFHYADIMRVNNVRNAFKIYNPTSAFQPTFYDSSLWESRKLEGDESLKRMIREGVDRTSVVCVLIGTETWSREWVRYEIARSVIDKKGLLAVDINGLNHHKDRVPHKRGPNPLSYLAVGKMEDGTYRLFEFRAAYVAGTWEWGWHPYNKYEWAVALPKYLPAPLAGYVTPLDRGVSRYDFDQQHGHQNIGRWIDLAAVRAGR